MRKIWAALIVSQCSLAAFAAGNGGAISGTVFESTGQPFAKAPVELRNTQTGQVFRTTSAASGKYSFADLASGTYDLTAAVPAVRRFEKKGITLQGGQTVQLDIHLEEGSQLSTLGEDPLAFLAEQARVAPSGPTPRTADGKPDLSGTWSRPRTVDPGQPEFLPWALDLTRKRQAENSKDSPQAHCLPAAVLKMPPLFELIQSPSVLVINFDDDFPGYKKVYIGRRHPKDPDPSWYGDNVGHWEGDTLVVDRVGFNDRVWLDMGSHPHTDKLHVIERYRRPDLGHLEIEITVDDPGLLAKPWTMKNMAILVPNQHVPEFICTENERDDAHLIGK